MKYIIFIIISISLFTLAPSCYGEDVTVDFFQSQINSKNQTEVLLMKNYVRGALDGIQWSNGFLLKSNKAQK